MRLEDLPENLPEYRGKVLLKAFSAVISDKESENGFMCVNEDGDKVFVPASHFKGDK